MFVSCVISECATLIYIFLMCDTGQYVKFQRCFHCVTVINAIIHMCKTLENWLRTFFSFVTLFKYTFFYVRHIDKHFFRCATRIQVIFVMCDTIYNAIDYVRLSCLAAIFLIGPTNKTFAFRPYTKIQNITSVAFSFGVHC